MTPDLIEKIARAISYRDIGLDWDDCAEEWKDIYRDRATAALAVALDEIGTELVEVLVQQADGHDHLRDLARRERDLTGAAIHAAEAAVSRSNARAIRDRIAEMKRAIKS